MPPGVVYTTFHHPITGANVVTTENSDWATNCPEYKVTAVQVEVANAVRRCVAADDHDVAPVLAEAVRTWPDEDDTQADRDDPSGG
jgi:formate dehydrogenase major subunit